MSLRARSRCRCLRRCRTIKCAISLKAFVDYARAHPGKLSYSAGLPGVSPHLTMVLIELAAKIKVEHIPYKIAAQGQTDTIGGQVPLNVSNFPATVSPIQNGRLRALAMPSANRASQLPGRPNSAGSVLSRLRRAVMARHVRAAGTPAAVLDKLHADINMVLRMPDMQQRLNKLVIGGTPTSRAEIARWAQVIKSADIPQE